ncbi:MAG: Lrp/AsnC family transcriptional regulator [Candidatus Bathyarchaeota archaeon]|nr:MAG: Lrp/AsnC family transcriptional regulator [Candidatus Bathyarchaeota archaeon]
MRACKNHNIRFSKYMLLMHLNLKDIDYDILFHLMKNSRISDRQLAKILGVSQPTITRRRARLEKKGVVNFTGIPNFAKMDLRIMAFNFVSWNAEGERLSNARSPDFMEKVTSFLNDYPNVVFASTGQGLGMGRMSISFHKSYADYTEFIRQLERDWGEYLKKRDTFIVSLESDNIVRPFSFATLVKYLTP